jgi:hypothetical protein
MNPKLRTSVRLYRKPATPWVSSPDCTMTRYEALRYVSPRGVREGNLLFIKIAILMSGLGLVNACTVTPAHVEVNRPVIVVPAVTVEPPPPMGYCPPRNAKKGWC